MSRATDNGKQGEVRIAEDRDEADDLQQNN
jgi:hypothetical protein